MTGSNMITGIPLRSLGCQSLWPIFVLVMLRRRRRVREYGCYQFFAIENECKICVTSQEPCPPRQASALVRQMSFEPTQWNRLCKNGYACRSPDRPTMDRKNKQSNRNRKQHFFRMRPNGILEIRFWFCLVWFPASTPRIIVHKRRTSTAWLVNWFTLFKSKMSWHLMEK